ncbi:hypothetical protein KBH77_02955 [Patescibacteria group bacterium]|nr:hypothetical protein [Patescibacteria group bacterium]
MIDNFIPFNSFIVDTSTKGKIKFNKKMLYLEDSGLLKNIAIKKDFSYTEIKTPVSEYPRRNNYTDPYNKRIIKVLKITNKKASKK